MPVLPSGTKFSSIRQRLQHWAAIKRWASSMTTTACRPFSVFSRNACLDPPDALMHRDAVLPPSNSSAK